MAVNLGCRRDRSCRAGPLNLASQAGLVGLVPFRQRQGAHTAEGPGDQSLELRIPEVADTRTLIC